MELNYKNLEKIILNLGHKVSFQKETNQLMMTFTMNLIEYPVFLRIVQQNTILQLVMFLPCKSEESTLHDTLRLLNFFNREIDLPGFCFDEASRLIFYRVVIPTFDLLMPSVLILQKIFAVIPSIATTFAPLTQLVASGKKQFTEIHKEFTKKAPSKL